MALQNTGAENQHDVWCYYEMPALITEIEGRGNGIKTNVVNMMDIAEALARNPEHITKYFGYELSIQCKYDKTTGTGVLCGAHDTAKLDTLLENFIRKYVQCNGCGHPETEVAITKAELMTLECAACGYLSAAEKGGKLTKLVLKEEKQLEKMSRAVRKECQMGRVKLRK